MDDCQWTARLFSGQMKRGSFKAGWRSSSLSSEKLAVSLLERGMGEAALVDLVRKALISGLSNCVEWVNDRTIELVENNPSNLGLTAKEIKRLTIDFARHGGAIES